MTKKCEWCGNFHENLCYMVKAIEYYENGTIKRVEFDTPKHIHEATAQRTVFIKPKPDDPMRLPG